MKKEREYRQGIYTLLSEALKEPTTDFVAEQAAMAEFFREAWLALPYEESQEPIDWPVAPEGLKAFSQDYCRSFLYPPDVRVVPVESIYRRWTYDETVDVPFAGEKGYLMSDAALHMQALYERYGLEIPEAYQGMPDHLCLQLEFAAALLEHHSEQQLQVFVAEHLGWVDELYQEMADRDIPAYYRGIVRITCQFLSGERRRELARQ